MGAIHAAPVARSAWELLFDQFLPARVSDIKTATRIAVELVDTERTGDEVLQHGAEVADWLWRHGLSEAAGRMLDRVRAGFAVSSALEQRLAWMKKAMSQPQGLMLKEVVQQALG